MKIQSCYNNVLMYIYLFVLEKKKTAKKQQQPTTIKINLVKEKGTVLKETLSQGIRREAPCFVLCVCVC